MRHLQAALRLLPALLLAVTLAGCDSGGSNGGGGGALSGTLTYEVDGPSGEPIGVSEEFFWTQDGNPDCFANRSTNKSTPVEGEELSVSSVSNCDRDPDDFDGVRITVTPSNDVDLTVRILSDGDVVEETSETTDLDGFQGYRISIGETFDFGS
jgi:hypothetical protein